MRAAQEEVLVARNELCEVLRLVYVEVVLSPEVFKILKIEGEVSLCIHAARRLVGTKIRKSPYMASCRPSGVRTALLL